MIRTRTMILFLACFATIAAFPGASAFATDTAPYNSAAGVGFGSVFFGSFSAPATGGAVLSAPVPHGFVLIEIDDTFFGSQAATVTCIGDLGPATTVDHTTAGCGGAGCGASGLFLPGGATDVTVFVLTFLVDANLNVCGGTNGMLHATFY